MEKIINITSKDVDLIQVFIQNLGTSSNTFRYFKNRNSEILNNHTTTCMLLFNNSPVAYGHLDKEGDNVWLGVAVIESEKGRGYGKKIFHELLRYAKKEHISEIKLSVDDFNTVAINLYKKNNFIQYNKINNTLYFKYLL